MHRFEYMRLQSARICRKDLYVPLPLLLLSLLSSLCISRDRRPGTKTHILALRPVFRPAFGPKTTLPRHRRNIESIIYDLVCSLFFASPQRIFDSTIMSASSTPDVDLGNYEILSDFALEYAPVTVTKYRSKKTGFQVVVGNHKGKPDHTTFVHLSD
jgi:hypothetical protein